MSTCTDTPARPGVLFQLPPQYPSSIREPDGQASEQSGWKCGPSNVANSEHTSLDLFLLDSINIVKRLAVDAKIEVEGAIFGYHTRRRRRGLGRSNSHEAGGALALL